MNNENNQNINPIKNGNNKISFKHFRHATSILTVREKRFLIDPMLAPLQAYPPIAMTKNPKKNPLVPLPVDYKTLFNVDGVIITHNHNDHFDLWAKKKMPKDLPILCPKEDVVAYKELGFSNITGATENTCWQGLHCSAFPGTHGGGIFKSRLGKSSSLLLSQKNGISVYLTGDTLLTGKVKSILKKYRPEFVIANGGGARLKFGGKITMSSRDIISISKILPDSKIIAVHMDSLNHCFDTGESLKLLIGDRSVLIPEDGEEINSFELTVPFL